MTLIFNRILEVLEAMSMQKFIK